MHFLNASALYLLAFIPIVALLHFLKLRRQRHVVPSVMFWLGAIEDMKANVPFQRLRNSLLLILQLLFLFIAVVTVARPALRRPSSLQGQSILILENSASMQSTELGESRFEVAKAKALELIDRLDASSQMMIMDTSRPPRHIHQGFTGDKEKLRRAKNRKGKKPDSDLDDEESEQEDAEIEMVPVPAASTDTGLKTEASVISTCFFLRSC